MNVVVGILDQCGNTDNIVFVNTLERTLTWIPRDLYSFYIQDRVNAAYARGGHLLLVEVLKKLGFAANFSACVSNRMSRELLNNYKITVPVECLADYFYPIIPFEPIEAGKKIVSFRPPFETLEGERIHQFLGARFRVNDSDYVDLPDFERCSRQMLFLKQMLIEKFDFSFFLDKDIFSDPKAIEFLSLVDANYEFKLYKNCRPVTMNKKSVLVIRGAPLLKAKLYIEIQRIYKLMRHPSLLFKALKHRATILLALFEIIKNKILR